LLLNFDTLLQCTMFTINIVAISDISSRRWEGVNFAIDKDIFCRKLEKMIGASGSISFYLIFFRSCISKFVSDILRARDV